MKATILLLTLLAPAALSKPQPGLPFLLIWPTARSTALAGAMTGLADDPDATFFNPAGLAFQPGISATANYVHWLPGLIQGLHHAYGSAVSERPAPSWLGKSLAFGLDATYFDLGTESWSEMPPPPSDHSWRWAVGAGVAVSLSEQVAVGTKVKLVRSDFVPWWVWKEMPGLGIDAGSTGSTWACDVGALWESSARFSVGGNLVNLGPGISYPDKNEHDPSPAMLRLGACWTPVNDEHVRLRVLPELDKLLVGMFHDSTGTKGLWRMSEEGFRDAWKSLGLEITGLDVFTIRVGYFEDRAWQRGGFLFDKQGRTYRYSMYDLLTRKHLGDLKSIGLTWGFGIGCKDYFRFDVSSDVAIYDFPTSNWKFALVANDFAGGIRELKQGHEPWEE